MAKKIYSSLDLAKGQPVRLGGGRLHAVGVRPPLVATAQPSQPPPRRLRDGLGRDANCRDVALGVDIIKLLFSSSLVLRPNKLDPLRPSLIFEVKASFR